MRMARPGRLVIPLLAAFTALALVVAGLAIAMQMKERNIRLAKERELVLLKAEKESLEEQIGRLTSAKQDLEEHVTRMKAEFDEKVAELDQERQAKEQLAKSVEDRQREIDRISKDLEQARTERQTVAQELDGVKDQQKSLKKQLAQIERDKAELEAKQAEQLEASAVNLDTVVVGGPDAPTFGADPALAADATQPARPPEPMTRASAAASLPPVLPSSSSSMPSGSAVQGQVVVVNREYDFVVMNLGRNHGLAIGQEFQIVRGQEVLGRVKVEKVYDELAAASILPNSKKDAIREGDLLKSI